MLFCQIASGGKRFTFHVICASCSTDGGFCMNHLKIVHCLYTPQYCLSVIGDLKKYRKAEYTAADIWHSRHDSSTWVTLKIQMDHCSVYARVLDKAKLNNKINLVHTWPPAYTPLFFDISHVVFFGFMLSLLSNRFLTMCRIIPFPVLMSHIYFGISSFCCPLI